MTDDWRSMNLANWESRVPLHTAPDGYELAGFDDPEYLSPVVRYDLPRLGRLDGLDVVHLQCHIGTDTVSLARLGARSVTGLDFSPAALDAGIGAICWLPDIRRWAAIVAELLRPGGRLFIREGHPVLWAMSDPRPDGLLVLEYPYFETGGTVFVEHDTYAGDGVVTAPESVSFNHGLGEIFTALTEAGLAVTALEEHREVPWNPLDDAMIPSPDFEEEYILAEGRDRLPLTYTLQAVKR
jgi:SAM-dependent methyltransferase